LSLTGEKVRGIDLVRCGLATHFVPQERLPGLLTTLKHEVSADDSTYEVWQIVDQSAEIAIKDKAEENIDEINQIFDLNHSHQTLYAKLQQSDTQFGSYARK
jgi:enoyl-CoA hydratase/carnithine racemase